jgi:hypothetical protein
MSNIRALSEDRLHRLLPSDIDRITQDMSLPGFAETLLGTYGSYLKRLTKPLAVELDDVTRITAQLAMTGLWRAHGPKKFIEELRGELDPLVVEEFCDTLHLDLSAIRPVITGSAAAE